MALVSPPMISAVRQALERLDEHVFAERVGAEKMPAVSGSGLATESVVSASGAL